MSDHIIKLANEGPSKHESAKRRVRGLLGATWLFDTLEAEYVWEHNYYPQFYIPFKAIEAGPGEIKDRANKDGFWTGTLHSGGSSVEVTVFEKGELNGLTKVTGQSLDWYAEDEKLLGPHPKDPYKRIECLPSSRKIRIEVDRHVVAESSNNVFLHETLLRTRYYLQPTSVVDWSFLKPSDTKTFCPYKGEASYYHLQVGDRQIKDVVWYYVYPTAESAQVQGRLCFYNEKVTVFVDGEEEK